MDWNVIVTVRPGPQHERDLLGALNRFGRFRPTQFHDVCLGHVSEIDAFLEAVHGAIGQCKGWVSNLGRVIPADVVLPFTSETLVDRLVQAVVPLMARLTGGSFAVRVERRGLAGEVGTQQIEAAVGEQVAMLASAKGTAIRTDLEDPDFVLAVEIVGHECGLALLPRELRERHPFVRTR